MFGWRHRRKEMGMGMRGLNSSPLRLDLQGSVPVTIITSQWSARMKSIEKEISIMPMNLGPFLETIVMSLWLKTCVLSWISLRTIFSIVTINWKPIVDLRPFDQFSFLIIENVDWTGLMILIIHCFDFYLLSRLFFSFHVLIYGRVKVNHWTGSRSVVIKLSYDVVTGITSTSERCMSGKLNINLDNLLYDLFKDGVTLDEWINDQRLSIIVL